LLRSPSGVRWTIDSTYEDTRQKIKKKPPKSLTQNVQKKRLERNGEKIPAFILYVLTQKIGHYRHDQHYVLLELLYIQSIWIQRNYKNWNCDQTRAC
jgi:hypothetical protein